VNGTPSSAASRRQSCTSQARFSGISAGPSCPAWSSRAAKSTGWSTRSRPRRAQSARTRRHARYEEGGKKSKKNSTRSMGPGRASGVSAAAPLAVLAAGRGAAAENPGMPALAPPPDPLCSARVTACLPGPYLAVFSAFPAELAPLLAAADVTETIATGERVYHVGTLAGARVVLVRLGIGLVNAATTTRAVLDRFDIPAVVFSGGAGTD